MTDYPPCEDCQGRCCKWILVPYDQNLQKISEYRGAYIVEKEGNPWAFAFYAPCGKLTGQGKCAIYAHRPTFCRENPIPGDGICAITRDLERLRALRQKHPQEEPPQQLR